MNTFKTLALATLIASAQAAFTCVSGDFVTPIKGTDETPGVIAAGPTFTSPSNSSLLTTDDNFHVMFDSVMVGKWDTDTATSLWTRELKFLVTGPSTTFADAAALATAIGTAPDHCKGSVDRQSVGDLASVAMTLGQSTCEPKFDFPLPWERMRGAASYTGCGWNEDTSDATNFIYTARVHAYWSDSDGATPTPYIRNAAMTYYPVTVSFEKAKEQNSDSASNNTAPYVADSFSITGVSYDKSGSSVSLKVAYTVSTYWPYLVMPNKGNAALSEGLPADAEALTVPYSYADGAYSVTGAFASSTGCGLNPTSATARPADGICTFTQEVTYTWTYGTTDCDAGSASDFSIGFATCVYNETAGAANGGCLSNSLVDNAGTPNTIGAFKIGAGLNLCKAPANTYSVNINSALAPTIGTVDVGKAVNFATSLSAGKQFKKLEVWSAAVEDITVGGKGASWALVANAAVDSMGARTAYTDDGAACTETVTCTLTLSYVPNVGATDASSYMVVLADRAHAALTFRTTVRVRFYWDSVNTDGGTGFTRRLMYRDQTVSSIAQTQDLAQSADVRIRVANTVATGEASSGLSTAAIAGIATAGVVLVATAGVIGALVYRKRRAVIAAEQVDSEKGKM